MNEPIRIVNVSWTHRCLRIPGREGEPITLHLEGMGGCLYCGQPDPVEQGKIDRVSAKLLRQTQEEE